MSKLRDLRQHRFGQAAIGGGGVVAQGNLMLQARHPNLEKLIHVGGEDQQEH